MIKSKVQILDRRFTATRGFTEPGVKLENNKADVWAENVKKSAFRRSFS